jgi:DNA-binding transcriptional LysR family regulator
MGMGVAVLPQRCAQSEIARGLLKAVHVPELGSPRQVRLVYRRDGEFSHAAQSFLDLARRTIRSR